MIVLGIDPGTAALGWGIIDRTGGTLLLVDAGCLETSPDLGLPDRLLAIHRFLGELIARHDPAIVAVERLFFSRNAQTAFAVGQARGVVLLAAAEAGRIVREATPNEVKRRSQARAADKGQVARMPALPGLPGCLARRRGRRARGRDLAANIDGRVAEAPGAPHPDGGRALAARRPTTGQSQPRKERRAARRDDRLGGWVVGAVGAGSLVIEVGGIGYRVFAAPRVIATAETGRRLKLHTYHLVRDNLQALYGFASGEELGFFNLLLTVTGVGPKVAMAIVGSRPTAELQLAILQQDQAMLVAIPGIGRKLAERVIFALKVKVAAAGLRRGRRRRGK